MFKKLIYIFMFMSTAIIISCDDDLSSLNVDITQPSASRTDLMMTGAIRTAIDPMIQQTDPIMYVQHLAETQYTSTSTYANSTFDYAGFYVNALQNFQLIIDLNTEQPTNSNVLAGGSNANQIAVAMIMKSWLIWKMTDRWGYLPYTEALKGEEDFSPKFDSQAEIYTKIFADLDSAISMLDEGGALNGDILLNGDISAWRTFAYSIKALAALRISDVDSATAQSQFTSAIDNAISSNAENVYYTFVNQDGNYSFWYDQRYIQGRRDYAVSDTFLDVLLNLDDPRLPVFADVALNSQQYVGMPYGLPEADAGAISNNDISFMSQSSIEGVADLSVPVITNSTILFAKAEAVERGWMSGNAEDYYKQAIQASWDQWGVTGNINSYTSQNGVKYNPSNWKMSIGNQKWIALYLDGQEAWAEWRRLDYPMLTPSVDAQTSDNSIPVRHGYPSSAAQLNEENYNAAVSAQGADDLITKLWWDMN